MKQETQHTENLNQQYTSNTDVIVTQQDMTIVDTIADSNEVETTYKPNNAIDQGVLLGHANSFQHNLADSSSLPNEGTIEAENYVDVSRNPLEKITDLTYLKKRTQSDPTLMMEMIKLYLEQTPPLLAKIKTSFKQQDWNSLHLAIHKMLPSFSIIGMNSDYENIAKTIQNFANCDVYPAELVNYINTLETGCLQAFEELNMEVEKIKNSSL